MLEIVLISIEGRYVSISTISLEASINGMVCTCVSNQKAHTGDVFNTESCRPEVLSDNSRTRYRAAVEESRELADAWRHHGVLASYYENITSLCTWKITSMASRGCQALTSPSNPIVLSVLT